MIFLKIDAEGVEYSFLKEGLNSLRTFRPANSLSLNGDRITLHEDSLEGIWDLLKELDYKVVLNNRPTSREEFSAQKDLFDVFLLPGDGLSW